MLLKLNESSEINDSSAEIEFLTFSNNFRIFKEKIFNLIRNFSAESCVIENLKFDVIFFDELFKELKSFLQFKSAQLKDNLQSVSNSFFCHPFFVAFKGLYRIIVALSKNRWYFKSKIHSKKSKKSNGNIDFFLNEFFGLDSDFIEEVSYFNEHTIEDVEMG
jgi:hypothetical protein